jgi:hypothetical protein
MEQPRGTITDAQAQAYALANPEVVFNPDTAIAKKWLALKEQGILIGVPIGPEMTLSDGTGQRAQAFTSGAVLVWTGGDDVDLR